MNGPVLGLGQLEADLWKLMFLMTRVGAAMLAAPIFGARTIPVEVRIIMAGAIGLFIMLWVPVEVPGDTFSFATLVALLGEVMIGMALGFVLPVILLISLGWDNFDNLLTDRYLRFVRNSVALAAIAAGITVTFAVLLGFNARLHPTRAATAAVRVAGLGYAVPGGVIAVGLLVPFAAFDNALDAVMEARFGFNTGLLITGSVWLLIAAYVVRFMAAALSAYDAGLSTINPNMDAVARTLGRTPRGMLSGIHLPILRPSILTGLLIVFVDVMKELPATLIMRPFNFDTLAVQAHRLASDERLSEAAVPSLVIAAVGLLPVILLCLSLGNGRTARRFVPEPETA